MYVEEFILKVGKDTNHIKAGKAIATNVMAYRKVYIDVIGASANYIATKAFIEATTILVVSGCSISFLSSYKVLKTSDSEIKTAVR